MISFNVYIYMNQLREFDNKAQIKFICRKGHFKVSIKGVVHKDCRISKS